MATGDSDLKRNMQAFDQLKEIVLLVNPEDASVLACNREACEQLALAAADICCRTLCDIRDDEYDAHRWQQYVEAVRRKAGGSSHHWYLRAGGEAFAVEEMAQSVCWDGRERLLISARDLTARASLGNEEISDREPLLRFVLDEATDGMWDWNVVRDEVFYSMPLKRMLGYGPYEIDHNLFTWKDSIHPDDQERVGRLLDDYLNGRTDRYEVEYRLGKRQGGYLWIHDRGLVTGRDENGRALRVVGMVRNIHERKQMEEQLLRMATVDELTGLLNRRAGYVAFERLLRLADRDKDDLSIALLDLDAFKTINDHYGHSVGDLALAMTARVFSSRIRASDVLMRWGGEEFLLVMPHTASADARQLVDELRTTLASTPLETPDDSIHMTVSAGLASRPQDGLDVGQLVHAADNALYSAKSQGRNCVAASH